MSDVEEIENLKRQIEEKKNGLVAHKKAFPKFVFVVLLSNFLIPLVPHKRIINLVAENGYWGAIKFGAPIALIISLLVFYILYLRFQDEIENLQKELNRKKNH